MNKKFSTLMAGLLLVGSVFTVNAQTDSPLMPRSATFVGADVTKLTQVGTGTGNYKSNGFYQLSDAAGDKVLAMVWDARLGSNGMYKLMLRELANENTPLDNTLWSISASWDQTSGTVNYVLVNKATLLPLQVAIPENTTPVVATIEGAVTNWVWNTNVNDLEDVAFKSTINASEVVYLTLNTDGETVEVTRQAANAAALATLELKPVEAGRIILTADQINSKLNNAEGIKATRVDFIFNPDVVNPVATDAKNIIAETAWVAEGRTYGLDKTIGKEGELIETNTTNRYKIADFAGFTTAAKDIDEGYIQLISYKDWESWKRGYIQNPSMLMVDTAYFDSAINNKYNLKLAAKTLVKNENTYKASVTNTAYATFQDQSLFKFVYEPTYDRVLIQAKQTTKVSKADLAAGAPWAYQVAATNPGDNKGFTAATAVTATSLETAATAFDPIKDNLVKLVYLTPTHSELTVDLPDTDDVDAAATGFGGALTTIKMDGTKNFGQWTFANIKTDFYYIQNAKKKSTALIPAGGWAYQDLTATNNSGNGNVVYSAEKFETMPSAQWYISGNAGYFTIKNRESQKAWSTQYWYAVKDAAGNDVPNLYTNYGTFNGSGIGSMDKDTIRLAQVPTAVLGAEFNGYLNITQPVAKADTSVFTFKYVTPLEVDLGLTMGTDSVLIMKDGEAMKFKLERVSKDNRKYGISDALVRASYYIYADEVSSNSSEQTGYEERKYVVLEGGKYRLATMYVYDNADGTTSLYWGNTRYDRAEFLVKEIGAPGENYVLVDPNTQSAPTVGQGTAANGVRMAMDQNSLTMRANGLPSVAENVYTNSLLKLKKAAAGNYISDLAYGDTVEVFSNDYPEVKMYENLGMLSMSSLEAGRTYNTALFVDTAYVREKTAKPQYMFALRPQFDPNCNFTDHNHHAIEGDYLMHLADSVDADAAKYTWDNKKFARLGFIPARHEGDSIVVKSSGDVIKLDNNSKDQFCTFALRYVDTNRDAFYLETLYKKGTPADRYNPEVPDVKGWVRWHNGVPVVVNDLSQAGKFDFKATTQSPVSNEGVNASEVTVVATNGAVIINGAQGKAVSISNVLGQIIARTVLSSDNATIAAPAGVVIVAVEGEDAVKAIVK